MKNDVLLLAKECSDTNRITANAAVQAGRRLRQINNSQQAFELLRVGLFRIDCVIIDVDPGIHGMSILEAVTALENAPPVIVVTGFEECDMTPIAHRHGAIACIAKPFKAGELASLIEEVCPETLPANAYSSDVWGHPHRKRKNITRKCVAGCKDRSARAASTPGEVCASPCPETHADVREISSAIGRRRV